MPGRGPPEGAPCSPAHHLWLSEALGRRLMRRGWSKEAETGGDKRRRARGRSTERVAKWGTRLPRSSRVAQAAAGDARRTPPSERPRPRRTRPLLRRRSSAASPRGRGDLRQDPRGARATPPAPPPAPPFPAEGQGRAGHGSGTLWLGVHTHLAVEVKDLESPVYSKRGPRVSRSAPPGSVLKMLRLRPKPIESKSAYLAGAQVIHTHSKG